MRAKDNTANECDNLPVFEDIDDDALPSPPRTIRTSAVPLHARIVRTSAFDAINWMAHDDGIILKE